MKKIETKRYKKIQADLIDHPPIDGEEDLGPSRKKKKKKIYQLGLEVEDVGLFDVD